MSWAPAGPERFRLYDGGATASSAVTAGTGLASLATPSQAAANETKPWHPSNPLFAFGVIAAAAFGLMAVSTGGGVSVRLGKATASATGSVGVGT